MKRKYYLKNKKRFYTFLAIVSFLLVFTLSANISYGLKESSYKTITVKNGDTLWSIAERYNHSGDIRKYIYKLKKINNMDTAYLYADSTIKIPEN